MTREEEMRKLAAKAKATFDRQYDSGKFDKDPSHLYTGGSESKSSKKSSSSGDETNNRFKKLVKRATGKSKKKRKQRRVRNDGLATPSIVK